MVDVVKKVRKNWLGLTFVVLFLLIGIFTVFSQSATSFSFVNIDGQYNWLISYATSSYADNTQIINSGDKAFGENIVQPNLKIITTYKTSTVSIDFNEIKKIDLTCQDGFQGIKSTGIYLYPYDSPDGIKANITANVKISANSIVIFDKDINVKNPSSVLSNGIILERKSLTFAEISTLSMNGNYLVYIPNKRPYIVSRVDLEKMIKNSIYTTLYYTPLERYENGASLMCPIEGVSEFKNDMETSLALYGSAAGSMGGVVDNTTNLNLNQFNPSTGILTLPASRVGAQFTLSIPSKVGSTVIWTPLVAKPRIENLQVNQDKITDFTYVTFKLCNDADIASGIDVVATAVGASLTPSAYIKQVGANACVDETLIASKKYHDGTYKIIITAYSRQNIVSKSITVTNSGADIPITDPCVRDPTLSQCKEAKNQTSTESCIPLIQKPVTTIVGGTNYNLWGIPLFNWGGTAVQGCEWDILGTIFVIIFGVILLGILSVLGITTIFVAFFNKGKTIIRYRRRRR